MEKANLRKRAASAVTGVIAFVLAGCVSMDPDMARQMLRDAPGTMRDFGTLARKPSSMGDMRYKVAAARRIIGTVEKYRRLSRAQQQEVERIAQRKFDRTVAQKKRAIAPTYKKRKKEVESKPISKAEKEKQIAKIDTEWQAEARKDALDEYGSGIAVPVENPEGKPVVAFAKIKNGEAVAEQDAYVLSHAPSTGSTVAHSGGTYTVVNEEI